MCPPRSGSQVARPRAPHAGERKCVPNKVTTQPKLPGLGDRRSGKGNAKPKWLQDGGPGDGHSPALAVTPVPPRRPDPPSQFLASTWVPMHGNYEGLLFPEHLSLDLSRQSLNPKRQLRRG